MTPDPREILLEGESHEQLMALFQDLLGRWAFDPENPGPLEVWRAWEFTKVLWRIKRAGVDADEVKEAFQSAHRFEQQRLMTAGANHRAALIQTHVNNIKNLQAVYKQVEGDLVAAPQGLRVVK